MDAEPKNRKPTLPQAAVLEMLRRYWRDNGRPPTVREIGESLGIASTNGVMCHLKALVKKGLVEHSPPGPGGQVTTRGLWPAGLRAAIAGLPLLAEGVPAP